MALLLALAACDGQRLPDPVPVTAVDLNSLTLIPYTDKVLGIRGLVPEGWVEAYPGQYAGVFYSGPPADHPGTALLQRLEASLTLDQAKKAWLQREDEGEFPKRVGNRETQSFTWDLFRHRTETPRGPTEVDIALAAAGDGVYSVELWTTPDEYEALHEAVFLSAVDALAPASTLASRYEDYAEWPVVAAIEGVGNNAHHTVEFTLDRCTRLRLYAIGEADKQGMVDYGSLESAATGQALWQMYYFETESAGYHRNRRADRSLTLPPGTYRLHFQTDGTHSFGDWGDRPPGHRFWGIVLFEEPESEGNAPTCWHRAELPEELGWSPAKLDRLTPELERLKVAALMVVTEGQVVLEWGKTANNFLTHSMRKSLLSALYGIFVAENKIDLSRTLADLGIDDLTPLTKSEKQATVLDLLQARSGVYIPAGGETKGMSAGRPERGSHKHGTHWYYNNWDFNALGTIFDQQMGEQDIYQAFEDRIAAPTGMQDYFPERLGYVYFYALSQHPYYGFRVSARDLARFGQLYLQEGAWDGEQIIPAGWVEESTRAYSKTEQSGTYSGYGYMWWIATEDLGPIKKGAYCASGYGGHTVEVLPDLNTVIVIRFNTDVPGFENLAGAPVDRLIRMILECRNR